MQPSLSSNLHQTPFWRERKQKKNKEEKNVFEELSLWPIRFFCIRKLIGKLFKKLFLCFTIRPSFFSKIAFSFIDEIKSITFSDQSQSLEAAFVMRKLRSLEMLCLDTNLEHFSSTRTPLSQKSRFAAFGLRG